MNILKRKKQSTDVDKGPFIGMYVSQDTYDKMQLTSLAKSVSVTSILEKSISDSLPTDTTTPIDTIANNVVDVAKHENISLPTLKKKLREDFTKIKLSDIYKNQIIKKVRELYEASR